MKKLAILALAILTSIALRAQWVDDPVNNTFIANSSSDAGEIYVSTDEVSGDTYVQWTQFASNGWAPTLQRVNFAGEPQWGSEGIHPSYHNLATWSQGIAMVATTDNAVVSCFSTEAGNSVALKINADGTYAWGEQGVMLFNGAGGSRTELLAGDDGGVWALATDITNTYLCYINADGTTNPTITISDNGGANCTFALMVPGFDNSVMVVYEKESWAYTYYYEKEIYVVGYTKDGVQIGPETRLMAPQTMGGSYIHYVVPDGVYGGYVFIWHAAIGGVFNTYVFHFDATGFSTISDPNGIAVHSPDPANFYLDAYGTVDPNNHDLLIAYHRTDVQYQAEYDVYVNRITTTGEKVWGDGLLVAGMGTTPVSDVRIDAFEDGSGFSVAFDKGTGTGYYSVLEALGFDMQGNNLWNTEMRSTNANVYAAENSSGYHLGQNLMFWVNSGQGGVYGQNIHPDGTMGPTEVPQPCYAPESFDGKYEYDDETGSFGVDLSWIAPAETPLYYKLYREDANAKEAVVIEIDPEATSYFDEPEIGSYSYQLTAVYEHCESEFALTPDGYDHLSIEVTSVTEHHPAGIVKVLRIYTLNGQQINLTSLEELKPGIYILQGLTQDGGLVTQKIVVD